MHIPSLAQVQVHPSFTTARVCSKKIFAPAAVCKQTTALGEYLVAFAYSSIDSIMYKIAKGKQKDKRKTARGPHGVARKRLHAREAHDAKQPKGGRVGKTKNTSTHARKSEGATLKKDDTPESPPRFHLTSPKKRTFDETN